MSAFRFFYTITLSFYNKLNLNMIVVILEFIFINLLLSSALSLTPLSAKVLRLLAIIICGCCLVLIQLQLNEWHRNRYPAAVLLTIHWLLLLRALNILLLGSGLPTRRSALPLKQSDARPTKTISDQSKNPSITSKIATGLSDLWSFRTYPRKVPNIPPFSSTDPTYVPSCAIFLRTEILKLALALLTLVLADITFPPPHDVQRLFSPRQERILSRLAEITSEEWTTKFLVTIGAGLGVWANFALVYSTAAILTVGLGHATPADWPPVFGDLRDAYTLRRFWGVAWHQTFRMPLDDTALFVVSRVLRIWRGSFAFHFGRFGIAFMLSGLTHYIGDMVRSAPYSLHSGASLTFFFMQFLGVMAELLVQAMWRRKFAPAAWTKWVGHVWVVLFLFWTGPSVAWPTVRSRRWGVDYNLPHSMFGKIGQA